jgi:hypothetical protein
MKKILIFDWNSVLTDVEVELRKRGFDILPMDGEKSTFDKADVIVVWNETELGGWANVIKEAQRQGKKTILVQHGRRGTSRIYPPFNEKLNSDVVCVWGANDRQRLISCGVDPAKIQITGTTIWGHRKPRTPHTGYNVVFSPEHWDIDVAENFIVADELRKLKGVNIITKILETQQNPLHYDNPVSSHRNSPDHLSIVMDTLSKADLIVAISESTFELIAEAMNIPVVIADCWVPKACDGDDRYKDYHREYSNACTMAKLKDLNKTIMQELKNPSRLEKERKQIAIDDGGFDIQDSMERLIEIITQ